MSKKPSPKVEVPQPRDVVRQRSAFSPRDVLYVLFRHKRKSLVTFAGVAGLATAAAVLLPNTYRSESKLTVGLGRESGSIDPSATIGEFARPMQNRNNELNTEVDLLGSRAVAEAVARDLGPDRLIDAKHPTTDTAIAEATDFLKKEVAVAVEPNSNNLNISFESTDPYLAHDVVAAYGDHFRRVRQGVFRSASGTSFFEEQRVNAEAELRRVRKELREYKDATGVADVTVQRGILLNRIGDLESKVDAARAERAAAVATASRLQDRLESMPTNVVTQQTTGSPNSSIETLRTRISELRLEEQDLSSRFFENDPKVRNVRAQIAEAERLLADATVAAETTVSVNPIREQLSLRVETEQASAEALEAKLVRLEADLAEARGGLATINDAQLTIDELEREARLVENDLGEFAKAYSVARMDRELQQAEISNVSISVPANLPVSPEGPNRPILLIAGLCMAAFASVGVAFAADALDHDVARPDDLLRVGEPASHLAGACISIPKLKSGQVVAKGSADYFDDILQSIRTLFGTAGRRSTDVAAGTRRQARGVFSAGRYILATSIRELFRLCIWLGNKTVSLITSPFAKSKAITRPRVAPAYAGGFDTGLSLEDEEVQDAEPEERTEYEPLAQPKRRVGRSVRLMAWAVARDAAAWRRRDERPNLQIANRDHRPAASSAVWRSARGLVEQIILDGERADRGNRVPPSLAVVAARPDAGTSTVAAHLAGVLAERVLEDTERRDGDIGDKLPSLLLKCRTGVGLSPKVDSDGKPTLPDVIATPARGLDELSINVTRTTEVRRILDVARRRYRHVVLDLPPVFDLLDTTGRAGGNGIGDEAGPRLAALAEVTVLVMEADGLRREAAARAVERLERSGANVAVAVLNKRRYPVPGWIYDRV